MTIELSATVERELRDLAIIQGRDVGEIVEEAVRQYLEASAITDLDARDVAEAQAKLIGELQVIPERTDGGGDDPEGRLARLEHQGLLRRASAPLLREVLRTKPPQDEGASVLEALLADRREG